MLPILIGLGLQLASGVASGISAASKAKQAEKDLQARRDKAERELIQETNTNFLDTATAKAAIGALRKQGDKQMEALNNNAIKSGASEEAKVAAASSINESQANAISRLAGMGTQYKQQIKDRYQSRLDNLDNALYNSKLQQSDSIAGIADVVGSTVGSGIMAYGTGAFNKTSAPKANKPKANTPKAIVSAQSIGVPTMLTNGIQKNAYPTQFKLGSKYDNPIPNFLHF